MKKIFTILGILALLVIPIIARAQVVEPNFWKKSGNDVLLKNSSWNLSVENLTANSITASSTDIALIEGDLNVGGYATITATTGDFATEGSIVPNDVWLQGNNNAGDGYVNLFKINTSDEIEVGAVMNLGPIELVEDSGAVTVINLPVSATPTDGDEESFTFSIDSNPVLKVKGSADNAGGADEFQVIVGQTLGSASNPSLAFGDGDTGFYEMSDDYLGVAVDQSLLLYFSSVYGIYGSVAGAGNLDTNTAASDTIPVHTFRNDTETGIGRAGDDQLSLISGGTEIMRLEVATTTVKNTLLLTPVSTDICDANGKGGMYYDSDDDHFYGCNGTTWVQLDN